MWVLLFSYICVVAMLLMLMIFQQIAHWNLRCAFRREFLMLEGIHEISKGIASEDIEASAGALMEHFHRMAQELDWQNTHKWRARHPFTMPDWPNYHTLLDDHTTP